MNTYILLRNNKESSSLNIDALRLAELKSTDLIWVECQSVCWQHPHEIAELKALVADSNKGFLTDSHISSLPIPQPENNPIEITAENDKNIIQPAVEKKLVFVELPKRKEPVKNIIPSFPDTISSDLHKYGGIAVEENKPIEKKSEDISIKYSRPLDEIKEMYVKNLKHQKSAARNTVNIKVPESFKKIAVYTGLIIAGAAIMLLISSVVRKKSSAVSENIQLSTANNTNSSTEPIQDNSTPLHVNEQVELSSNEILPTPVEKSNNPSKVKKTIVEQTENENLGSGDINGNKFEQQGQDAKNISETKPVAVENIFSQLLLHANDYGVGSFGGIRNLEITLHNDSKYLLEKVTAEVHYLNPEGIILKTEKIYFQSVAAGDKETVSIKKTKRGVKIAYKVIKIESKEISGATAGL